MADPTEIEDDAVAYKQLYEEAHDLLTKEREVTTAQALSISQQATAIVQLQAELEKTRQALGETTGLVLNLAKALGRVMQ